VLKYQLKPNLKCKVYFSLHPASLKRFNQTKFLFVGFQVH
jgi:hypothetical protein